MTDVNDMSHARLLMATAGLAAAALAPAGAQALMSSLMFATPRHKPRHAHAQDPAIIEHNAQVEVRKAEKRLRKQLRGAR